MRPDLPWNVAGVPPEAREAARAAARREGLSVGEWLTRRILRSLADTDPTLDNDASSDDWTESAAGRLRLEPEGTLAPVQRREFDAEGACRSIENELRNVVRRLDATERSQTESHRAVSKATAEMNVASREHTRA